MTPLESLLTRLETGPLNTAETIALIAMVRELIEAHNAAIGALMVAEVALTGASRDRDVGRMTDVIVRDAPKIDRWRRAWEEKQV